MSKNRNVDWDYSKPNKKQKVTETFESCGKGQVLLIPNDELNQNSIGNYVMFGWAIRGNDPNGVPVKNIVQLPDSRFVFLADDDNFCKMVTSDGEIRYYSGNSSTFDATKFSTYTCGGDNGYNIKPSPKGIEIIRNLKAIFYEHCDYQGAGSALGIGAYNIGQMGIANDAISSVKIPLGLKVTIYEHADFQGRAFELTKDHNCLINGGFNDATSSIKVELLPFFKNKINIISASYGLNCNGALLNNRNQLFRDTCNNKDECKFDYNFQTTGGDPAVGCGKTIDIEYHCGDGALKKQTVPAEAGFNGKVNLSCADVNPKTISLPMLQGMFNSSGCTNKLKEEDVSWWRGRNTIADIKNDMNAYGTLAKNCSGDTRQNEFCNPNGCYLFADRMVWLDANDTSSLISDNNGIAIWKDKSPLGNDFRVSSRTVTRPRLIPDSQNGYATLEFNRTSLIGTKPAAYPFDAFLVLRLGNFGHNDVFNIGDATNDNFNSLTFGEFGPQRWHNGSSGFSRTPNALSPVPETSTSYLIMNWTLANNNFTIRRNGDVLINTNSYTWGRPDNAIFAIGSRHNENQQPQGSMFSGNIGEIIVFRRLLNDEERNKVTTDLAKKWAVRIPVIGPNANPPVSGFPVNNLQLWSETSKYKGKNGSKLKTWDPDTTDKAVFFTNNTNDQNQYPTIRDNVLGGLPVLEFSTANQMELNNQIVQNNYTMVFVSRQIGKSNQRFVIGGDNKLYGYWGGGKDRLHLDGWVRIDGTPGSNTEWDIYVIRRNGSKNMMSRNGSVLATNDGGNGLNGLFLNMGGCCGGEKSDAQIAEFALWNVALDDNAVRVIETYLANKWKLNSEMDEKHPAFAPRQPGPPNAKAPVQGFPVSDLRVWAETSSLAGREGQTVNTFGVNTTFSNDLIFRALNDKGPIVKDKVLNGLPVLEFNPSQNLGLPNLSAREYTMIFLTRQFGSGKTNGRFVVGRDNKLYAYWGGGKDKLHLDGWIVNEPVGSNSDWDLYVIKRSRNGKNSLFRNGTKIAVDRDGGNSMNGLFLNSGEGHCCNGEASDAQLAEFLVWDRNLPDNEIAIVETYLAKKWGLQQNMDKNHPGYLPPAPNAVPPSKDFPVVNLQVWGDAADIKEGFINSKKEGFQNTPPVYDNAKVYKVGDVITFNGVVYKMVEGAGAPGYAPNRPGDKLWQKQTLRTGVKVGALGLKKTFADKYFFKSANGPTYIENGLNGLPILEFTPSQSLALPDVNFREYTLAFVSRQFGPGKTNGRFIIGRDNKLYGYHGGMKDALHLDQWIVVNERIPSNNEWDIYIITRNLKGENNFYRNGQRIAVKRPGGNPLNGLFVNQGDGHCCNNEASDGQLAEFIVWDRELTDNEVIAVETQLATKWGLQGSLDDSHPAFKGPVFTNTVKGCEGQNAELTCPPGQGIKEGRVTYGKWQADNCGGMPQTRVRARKDLLDLFGDKWQDEQKFTVNINNGTFKGDPLGGVVKSFEVQYNCGPVVQSTANPRYIRVSGGNDYLQIAQIAVIDKNGNNVARGKKVNTSPVWEPASNGSKITDGTLSMRNHPDIYHSQGGQGWVEIDLEAETEVKFITIYNRNDCCRERLNGYRLTLLDNKKNKILTRPLNGSDVQTYPMVQIVPINQKDKPIVPTSETPLSQINPAFVDGLDLWLDSSDIMGDGSKANNGTPVTYWVDKTGYGKDATPKGQPAVVKVENNRQYVSFDGNKNYGIPYPKFPNQNYTVFTVQRLNVPNGNYQRVLHGSDGDGALFIGALRDDVAVFTGTGGWNDVDNVRNNDIPVTTSNKGIFRIVTTKVTGNKLVTYVDSTRQREKNGTTRGFDNLLLGGAVGQNFNGDVAEVIIYNSALNDINRQTIEAYLANKWGLTEQLDSDHPVKPKVWSDYRGICQVTNYSLVGSIDYGSGKLGKAGYFNNDVNAFSKNYVTIGNSQNIPMSVSFWFNADSNANQTLVGLGNNDLTNSAFNIDIDQGDNLVVNSLQLRVKGAFKPKMWNHLALTIDENGNTRLYVNGRNIGGSKINTRLSNIEKFIIGGSSDKSKGYKGFLQYFMVFSRALNEDEVNSLNNLERRPPSDRIIYVPLNSDCRAESDNLPPITGLSLWLDGADPLAGSKVNEGDKITRWFDKSGAGKDAIAMDVNNLAVVLEKGQNAKSVVNFNGRNSYLVKYPSFPNKNYTIFTVQKLKGPNGNYQRVLHGSQQDGTLFVGVLRDDVAVFTGTGGWNDVDSNTAVDLPLRMSNKDNFRIVATKVTGDVLTTFVDGTQLRSKRGTTRPFEDLIIGGAVGQNFFGDIAEIIIYDRSLNDAQRNRVEGYLSKKWGLVDKLDDTHPLKTRTWVDYMGLCNVNNYELTGGLTFVDGKLGKAAFFDNDVSVFSKNYITTQNFQNIPITISFWFNTLSKDYQTIIGLSRNELVGDGINFDVKGNSFMAYLAIPKNWTEIKVDNVIEENKWYHVTLTIDKNFVAKLYINGEERGTSTGSGPIQNSSRFIIGGAGDKSRGFKGYIQYFSVYDRVLDTDEVYSLSILNRKTPRGRILYLPLNGDCNVKNPALPPIDGVTLWLDGADPIPGVSVKTNTNLDRWLDKSGFNRDAVSNDINNPAVVKINDNDSKTIVNFNGRNTYLITYPSFTNKNYTIFMVQKLRVPNGNYQRSLHGSQQDGTIFIGALRDDVAVFTGTGGWNDVDALRQDKLSLTTSNKDTWRIVTVRVNNNELTTFIDSARQNKKNGNTRPFDNFILGGGVGQNFNGDIAELLIYESSLNENKRQQVEEYLAKKWNLVDNLDISHPIKPKKWSKHMGLCNVNNYKIVGELSYSEGKFGNAAFFNNKLGSFSTNYALLSNAQNIPLTLSFWFNINDSTTYQTILSVTNKDLKCGGVQFDVNNGSLSANMAIGNKPVIITSNGSIKAKTWYHVALTIDSAFNAKLYINGIFRGSDKGTNKMETIDTILLAGSCDKARGYQGFIQYFSVFNRDLNEDEIYNLSIMSKEIPAGRNTYVPLNRDCNTVDETSPPVPNISLWLDGSDPLAGETIEVGSNVHKWLDKSGSGKDAITNDVNNSAVLVKGENNTYLNFNGRNTYLAQYTNFPSRAFTIFTVQRLNNSNGSYQRVLHGSRGDGAIFIGVLRDDVAVFTGTGGWNDVNANLPQIGNTNTWRIVSTVVGDNKLTTFVDGYELDTKNGNTRSFDDLMIGGAVGQNFNGDIGEVIVFESRLPPAERKKMERYLAVKWGLEEQVDNSVISKKMSVCGKYGKPGKDSQGNPLRVYTKTECDILGGNWASSGECTKKEGGSFSTECNILNFPLEQTVIGCENQEANLTCPSGEVIKSGTIYFGKWDKNNCGSIPYKDKNHPSYRKSLEVLGENCIGQSNCKTVINPSTFKGDPQAGVVKQFEINYKCGPPVPNGGILSSKVKFVRIGNGSDWLQLSQVIVKNKQGENVSKGRKVTVSSVWNNGEAPGANAVDGVEQMKNHPNIFTSGDADRNTFWMVELDKEEDIASVEIYNRNDCCRERLGNYRLMLLDSKRNKVSDIKLSGKDYQKFTFQSKEDADKVASDRAAEEKRQRDLLAEIRAKELARAEEAARQKREAEERARRLAIAEAEEAERRRIAEAAEAERKRKEAERIRIALAEEAERQRREAERIRIALAEEAERKRRELIAAQEAAARELDARRRREAEELALRLKQEAEERARKLAIAEAEEKVRQEKARIALAEAEERERRQRIAIAEAEERARREKIARAEAEERERRIRIERERIARAEAEEQARRIYIAQEEALAREREAAAARAREQARLMEIAKAEAEAAAQAKERAIALAKAEEEAKIRLLKIAQEEAKARELAKAEQEARLVAQAKEKLRLLAIAEAEAKAREVARQEAEIIAKQKAMELAQAEARAKAFAIAEQESRQRAIEERKLEEAIKKRELDRLFAMEEANARIRAQEEDRIRKVAIAEAEAVAVKQAMELAALRKQQELAKLLALEEEKTRIANIRKKEELDRLIKAEEEALIIKKKQDLAKLVAAEEEAIALAKRKDLAKLFALEEEAIVEKKRKELDRLFAIEEETQATKKKQELARLFAAQEENEKLALLRKQQELARLLAEESITSQERIIMPSETLPSETTIIPILPPPAPAPAPVVGSRSITLPTRPATPPVPPTKLLPKTKTKTKSSRTITAPKGKSKTPKTKVNSLSRNIKALGTPKAKTKAKSKTPSVVKTKYGKLIPTIKKVKTKSGSVVSRKDNRIRTTKTQSGNVITRVKTSQRDRVKALKAKSRSIKSVKVPKAKSRSVKVPKAKSRSVKVPKAKSRSVKVPKAKSRSAKVPKAKSRSAKVPKAKSRSAKVPKAKSRSVKVPKAKSRSAKVPKAKSIKTNQKSNKNIKNTKSDEPTIGNLVNNIASGLLNAITGQK